MGLLRAWPRGDKLRPCPVCNGTGHVPQAVQGKLRSVRCRVCHGKGQV